MSIISETITSSIIPLNTFDEKALITLTTKKQQLKPKDVATFLFKNSINIKEAIVSILSNTGIAGFKFNVPKSEQIKMESDITDYYTDSNGYIQDHIARKPVTITLNGLHGEYFYSVNQIEDTLAKITPTLRLIKEFLPKLSEITIKNKIQKLQNTNRSAIQQEIFNATNGANLYNKDYNFSSNSSLNGVDLFKTFQDIYKLKSSQTRAYFFFEALWKSNETFTVETTWKRFDNMIIQSLTPMRDNNADITDFTVTFKQINIANSLYETIDNAAGRTREQLQQLVNKGLDKGEKVDTV